MTSGVDLPNNVDIGGHPLAVAPSGNLTLNDFQEAGGVCPEWNSAQPW